MYKIQYLNKISPAGTACFGDNYETGENVQTPDAIMVRSASMHERELPETLLAIARAGAGVNNIPLDKCSEKGIVVFNTPGANANAVKELVLCALFLTSRKIIPGIEWCKKLTGADVAKQIEKGKSQFVGPEIFGKKLGVIGLGAIGVLVANAAKSLGMEVYGYDPFLSVDSAWGLSRSVKHARSLDDIWENCDYITIHVPQTPDTKEMINAEAMDKMKQGVRVLNFARGGLVNSDDMMQALHSGKISAYATDFPAPEMIGAENVIAVPHLGASTPESEDNCARMAANELKDYLENGNIRHSVNMPAVSMPRAGSGRICLLHRNVPNTISKAAGKVAGMGINIENMQSKSRKEYAYTILDVTGVVTQQAVDELCSLEEVIRARVIR
ncbi:MAG: 3-phosphoglycerate dehydrogenase family protein [Oscillospiraceae bacterium]|nr:3-phosphoglycerate dehydrogenase family protein [Oscillospiraceae bacterium]